MKIKWARGYLAAALAVSLSWAFFVYPWLSGGYTIPYDAKAHFQPQIQFLAHALHTGQSPFWTPNVYGGSPQIADPQSMIFSPAFLLAYFSAAPSFLAVDAYSFGLLALAGFSVLMIFRDRKWHPAGATVAALAVAFGGTAVWRIQHLKQIEGFAFFMLCLWLLSRALERRSILYGLLSGFAAALMVVEPGQIALLGCYILTAYVIVHWATASDRVKAIKASVMPLMGGAVVAALLATVPILLTYLFVSSSTRPAFAFSEAARGALHPASLLTSVVGDLYGARDYAVDYWGPGSWSWVADYLSMSENMGQVYFGAIPLLLLIIGFSRGYLFAQGIRFFTAAGIVLLLFCLSWYTPFFRPIFDYVPGVNMFRRPSDATYQLGAMVAIMAGYVVHRLMTDARRPVSRLRRGLEAGVVAVIFACAVGVAVYRGHLSDAKAPIQLSIAVFLVAGAALALVEMKRRALGVVAIPLLATVLIVDLAYHNGPNRSSAALPAEFTMLKPDAHNTTIAFLKANMRQATPSVWRDRVEISGVGFEWPNAPLCHNLDHVFGYNPLRLEEVAEGAGASETVAEIRQREFTPLFASYRSPLANMLGLRYIVVPVPLEQVDKHFVAGDFPLVARTPEGYIYENKAALPRVLFASEARQANFKSLIKTGDWPSFDPKRTVLLENAPPQSFRLDAALTASSVTLTRYENTVAEIEVETPVAGHVVLNDVWHPWWTATVDGRETPILRANVLFRAVAVPAGRHTVRFTFKPFRGAAQQIEAMWRGERTDGFEPEKPTHPPLFAPEAKGPADASPTERVREARR